MTLHLRLQKWPWAQIKNQFVYFVSGRDEVF
jgi:hypothetical protein